ncbi:MAG: hypothetical protein P4L87_13400 [Formivibrio sp.]|nr:hypothetical protein [Formivibrio sp.]
MGKYQNFRTLSWLLIPCGKNDLAEAEGFLNGFDQAGVIPIQKIMAGRE